MLDRITEGLTPENLESATALAAPALEIRGFGPVKVAAAKDVRARMWTALASPA
jgi:serine kinase of HPr protein (carbohydrate metabolism regulator)